MLVERMYQFIFCDRRRKFFERAILAVAIAGFVVHLAIIYLIDFGIIQLGMTSPLLKNPIAAAYTPFSFILIYEVYLLIFYIPKSILTYIQKQYEIITLIMIRRLFKDLSAVEISADWFKIKGDLMFTYDLVGSLLLFFLLYLFQQQVRRRHAIVNHEPTDHRDLERFIRVKKGIAVCLIPILFSIATFTLLKWTLGVFLPSHSLASSFGNINNIFFDEFFGVLIVVDVFLLLFSFFVSDTFHTIIRNSGFIVSTILIRLSFSVEGLVAVAMVVISMLFGLFILIIFNQYLQSDTEAAAPTSAEKKRGM